MEQKIEKTFFLLKIISFESGTTYSNNPEKKTFHWYSMCYKRPLKFNISSGKYFQNWFLAEWLKDMIKDLSCIYHVF